MKAYAGALRLLIKALRARARIGSLYGGQKKAEGFGYSGCRTPAPLQYILVPYIVGRRKLRVIVIVVTIHPPLYKLVDVPGI